MIRVDDDFALFLAAPRDEQHVVERGRVVQHGLVVKRGQDVPCPELQEVNPPLIHRKPQGLGPVRGKGLLGSEDKEKMKKSKEY